MSRGDATDASSRIATEVPVGDVRRAGDAGATQVGDVRRAEDTNRRAGVRLPETVAEARLVHLELVVEAASCVQQVRAGGLPRSVTQSVTDNINAGTRTIETHFPPGVDIQPLESSDSFPATVPWFIPPALLAQRQRAVDVLGLPSTVDSPSAIRQYNQYAWAALVPPIENVSEHQNRWPSDHRLVSTVTRGKQPDGPSVEVKVFYDDPLKRDLGPDLGPIEIEDELLSERQKPGPMQVMVTEGVLADEKSAASVLTRVHSDGSAMVTVYPHYERGGIICDFNQDGSRTLRVTELQLAKGVPAPNDARISHAASVVATTADLRLVREGALPSSVTQSVREEEGMRITEVHLPSEVASPSLSSGVSSKDGYPFYALRVQAWQVGEELGLPLRVTSSAGPVHQHAWAVFNDALAHPSLTEIPASNDSPGRTVVTGHTVMRKRSANEQPATDLHVTVDVEHGPSGEGQSSQPARVTVIESTHPDHHDPSASFIQTREHANGGFQTTVYLAEQETLITRDVDRQGNRTVTIIEPRPEEGKT